MGLNLIDRIQAKIELFRLEQRYTRRRNRRSTFVSNAVYVDGEYIYNTPNTTGSSSTSDNSRSAPQTTDDIPTSLPVDHRNAKRLNRWSSMPGFGSLSKAGGARSATQATGDWQQDWRAGASESR